MQSYTVNIDSITGRFGKVFKKYDIVSDVDFQPGATDVLILKKFIIPKDNSYNIDNSYIENLPNFDKKNGLKIYQIYYDQNQLPQLDYTPYFNNNCTKYFESQVMVDLINEGAHLDYSYFGVVAYKLREKLSFAKTYPIVNIANRSIQEFTSELYEFELWKRTPDVFSFQRHLPHDPVSFADRFHSGFSNYFKKIMYEIGYNWTPTAFENVFYCNYFTAKSEIYEHFVKTMLEPAMEVMEIMPELMQNSGYPKKLPEHLQRQWGIDFYPYHTFLCERMFSYYAHLNKLKCLHY
jgi:hypothetical protein